MGVSRRELLIASGLLTLAACAPQTPSTTIPPETPIRLPQDSPEFDTLNTLIQLEHREIALATEVLAGGRLDPRDAGNVAAIRDHHARHADDLANLVTTLGGNPSGPRARYVLPTPLGDARRAIETLTRSEEALVSAYKAAIAGISVERADSLLVSNLFSEATHLAGLRYILGSPLETRAFA